MAKYEVEMDDDVKAVAEFMQTHIPAVRLMSVAAGVAGVAPLLWGHYESAETVQVLVLSAPQIEQSEA